MSRSAGAITGTVVDEHTGLPVPDAYVVGRWTYRGSDGYGSRSQCTGLEVARTDREGRFSLPEARPRKEFGASVFVRGKELAGASMPSTGSLILRVRKFAGDNEARLLQYERLSTNRVCFHLAGTLDKLRPLFAAMDDEAATLPGLSEEQYRPGRFARSLSQLDRDAEKKR